MSGDTYTERMLKNITDSRVSHQTKEIKVESYSNLSQKIPFGFLGKDMARKCKKESAA